jgi:hypothetical protein
MGYREATARAKSPAWKEVVLVPPDTTLRVASPETRPRATAENEAATRRPRRRRINPYAFISAAGYVATAFFAFLLLGLVFVFFSALLGLGK